MQCFVILMITVFFDCVDQMSVGQVSIDRKVRSLMSSEDYFFCNEERKKVLQHRLKAGAGFPSIKVSGTLKLVPPKDKHEKGPSGGCLPTCLVSIWGYLFD
jgi:hypothetical protein